MPQIGIYSGDPNTILNVASPYGAIWGRRQIGYYYMLANNDPVGLATGTLTVDLLYFIPFPNPTRQAFDRIGFRTNSAIASLARFGIYDTDPATGLPRTLLKASGEIDVGAAGLFEVPLSITLDGDLYWIGVVLSATRAGVYFSTSATTIPLFGFVNIASGGTMYEYARSNHVYGPLPTTAPAPVLVHNATGTPFLTLRTA